MDYATREATLLISGLPIVVREQDGDAEQFLYDNLKRINQVLPQYWARLTVKLGDDEKVSKDKILKLRSPDIDQTAIEIFRAGTINDELILTGPCPECKRSVNYAVDFTTLDFLPIPDGKSGPDPTFEYICPRGNEIVWGYTTGYDEFEELDTPGFNPSRRVWKAIRSINGNKDIKLKDVLALPIITHRGLREDIQNKRCGYDTRIRLEHSCGSEVVVNLLSDPSFLMPGVPSQMID